MEQSRHEIELRVGQQYTHRLTGRGSAGYSWEYSLEGSPTIVQISREPGMRPDHMDLPEPGDAPPGSASVDELVRIRSLAPGRARLRCAQRRIWEIGRPPLREEIIDIDITAA
jgi:predicted secreted protein